MEAVVWHSIPWVPTTFLVSVHHKEPLVWFEVCDFCYIFHTGLGYSLDSFWISCCFLVTWRFCSFWSAYWGPLYAPAVHSWTGCWGGSTQPCFWALVVAFPHPHYQGELFHTASASSSTVAGSKELHQFSCFHAPEASSPAPTPPRPALFALQLGRCKASSPSPAPEASSPTCYRWQWSGGRGHLYLTHATTWHMKGS